MTFDEANEMIYIYEKWKDTSCLCFLGNPPCAKCENNPSEEEYKEAVEIMADERG